MGKTAETTIVRRARNIFEKVIAFNNLLQGAKKTLRGKKNKSTPAKFYFHLETQLLLIHEQLRSGKYYPQPYRMFEIREPKIRNIAAADFKDRIVHHAVCNVLDPIFESRLIFDTYACRVGKGSHRAVKRLQIFSRKHSYFLKFDIKKYFESIDHRVLKKILRRIIKDRGLLRLLYQIIDHPVPGNSPDKGLPIGNLTSQHFANLYLGELDHFIKDHLRIRGYLRYMDDCVLLASDRESLHEYLSIVRNFLSQELELTLKEKVTRIAPVSEGVPFLGFRIYPNMVRLQRVNLVRWRKNIKKVKANFEAGNISEDYFVASVRSRIAHIAHANSHAFRRREFDV